MFYLGSFVVGVLLYVDVRRGAIRGRCAADCAAGRVKHPLNRTSPKPAAHGYTASHAAKAGRAVATGAPRSQPGAATGLCRPVSTVVQLLRVGLQITQSTRAEFPKP